MSESQEMVIDQDLACAKCTYNLRTQQIMSRCSECGYPVVRSYLSAKTRTPAAWDHHAAYQREAYALLARLLGRNVDSIAFVHRVVRSAVPTNTFRPADHLTADGLCRAVIDFALKYYGNREDAAATLRFWRMERSDDVGQIVSGLVETGLVDPHKDASPEDFKGLCGLLDLFPTTGS